ncbi:MAG: hypothetical protein WBV82_16260 [Myxococcaceae bacterium]
MSRPTQRTRAWAFPLRRASGGAAICGPPTFLEARDPESTFSSLLTVTNPQGASHTVAAETKVTGAAESVDEEVDAGRCSSTGFVPVTMLGLALVGLLARRRQRA